MSAIINVSSEYGKSSRNYLMDQQGSTHWCILCVMISVVTFCFCAYNLRIVCDRPESPLYWESRTWDLTLLLGSNLGKAFLLLVGCLATEEKAFIEHLYYFKQFVQILHLILCHTVAQSFYFVNKATKAQRAVTVPCYPDSGCQSWGLSPTLVCLTLGFPMQTFRIYVSLSAKPNRWMSSRVLQPWFWTWVSCLFFPQCNSSLQWLCY